MIASFGAPAQVSLSITLAPPPLPYYVQPSAPGDDYIWSPGYWAWVEDDGDYHWVPGTWVLPPNTGDLWTPGYWAFENTGFRWHIGYWGRTVGYYGGLNYGYGYSGRGYQGGRWNQGHYRRDFHESARRPGNSQVSFIGGQGGWPSRPPNPDLHPRPNEHSAPSDAQMMHEYAAVTRPTQRATGSRERPLVAATPRPSAFEAAGAEHARSDPPLRQAPHADAEPRNGRPASPGRSQSKARPDAPSRADR